MLKRNSCNYSYEWQPYRNDYDKYEYDIRLKNGRVVENLYPNAGHFCSLDDREDIPESEIAEIRFSVNPKWGISKPKIETK